MLLLSPITTHRSDLGFDSNDSEDVGDPIPLANVSSEILQKVLDWCAHHKDDDSMMTGDDFSSDDLPPWDTDFLSGNMGVETLFKVVEAANYLEVGITS